MMNNQLYSLALNQINNLADSTRIVVLHPHYTQQHLILSGIEDRVTVYHRFVATSNEVNEQFERSVNEQVGKLREGSVVALEECEDLNPDSFHRFLLDLIHNRSVSRIFIFCRELPNQIIQDPELSQSTVMIPTHAESMLSDYIAQDQDRIRLEVRAFSNGYATLNGASINDWDGVLPRLLFLYLIDRGMTTRNEIFENFWPSLNQKEATNVFHVTKRKINESLGFDLTVYRSGFYRISPEIDLQYDVIRFNELVQYGSVAPAEEAIPMFMTAANLYRDQFLSSIDMPWAQQRRQELAENHAEAIEQLGDLLNETGNIEQAVAYYLQALVHSWNRDALLEKIIRTLRQVNRHHEALTIFNYVMQYNGTVVKKDSNSSLSELVHQVEQEIKNTF